MIIELDGGQHAERADEDRRRTALLAGQGYRVLRFWDNEVLLETEAILLRIAEALESAQEPSPQPSP